jgi:hypothetical protein
VSDDSSSAHFAGTTQTALNDRPAVAPEPNVIPGEVPTETELWVELWRAIDACILAESHLLHWLREDHPPLTAPMAEGVKHYDNLSAAFDLWAGCRGIERLRIAADAWRNAAAPTAVTRTETRQDVPRRLL